MQELINFNEYPIKNVLDVLLKDRTTNKNIIFATNEYSNIDNRITEKTQITTDFFKYNSQLKIEPRVKKSKEEKDSRTKKKAEVFTPSWICNKMNNHCDTEWFGRENVFNRENGQEWSITTEKIKFPQGKTWQDYINSKRLEITCGEAPYIVSRYDAATGDIISIKDRIGILDRKIRVINEHTRTEKAWFKWVKKAYQSVYGYEFQGDNLLIARSNLINTFVEYMQDRWNRKPTDNELKIISKIVSWNIWQMDGIHGNIPYGKPNEKNEQINLLELYNVIPNEINCNIYDWDKKKVVTYKCLKEGR